MLIPKKSLSQNFLLDNNILNKITNLITIRNKYIVEIGAGTGQLTKHIINKIPHKLFLLEKDNVLFSKLKEKYCDMNFVEIYNTDALKFNYNLNDKISIISNLPYNISTKIIINLLSQYSNIQEIIFMVQREVAEKLNYKLGKKNKFSFFIDATSSYKIEFNVSKKVFYPKPRVNSTIIKISPKKNNLNKLKLLKFTNLVFTNKRKKLKNVLQDIKFTKINELKYNEIINKRAEDLETKELIYLFNKF